MAFTLSHPLTKKWDINIVIISQCQFNMTHLRYHLQYSWDLKTEQFQRSTLFPTLQHFTLENHPLMHWYLQFYRRLYNVCESVQVRCQIINNCQGQQCQTYYVFLKGLYVSHVHSCVRLYDIRVNRSIQYFPKPLHWIILLQVQT